MAMAGGDSLSLDGSCPLKAAGMTDPYPLVGAAQRARLEAVTANYFALSELMGHKPSATIS